MNCTTNANLLFHRCCLIHARIMKLLHLDKNTAAVSDRIFKHDPVSVPVHQVLFFISDETLTFCLQMVQWECLNPQYALFVILHSICRFKTPSLLPRGQTLPAPIALDNLNPYRHQRYHCTGLDETTNSIYSSVPTHNACSDISFHSSTIAVTLS